jgi:hypothetical protein
MKLPDDLLASLDEAGREAYLVAADWLLSQGNPWGELINAQCQLENVTSPLAFLTFRKQVTELLGKHGLRWLGGPVPAVWFRGFVERVEPEDLSLLPSVLDSEVGGLARDFELAELPSALERSMQSLLQASPPRLRGLTLARPGPTERHEAERRGTLRRRRRAAPPPAERQRVRIPSGLAVQRLEVRGVELDWSFDGSGLRRIAVSDADVDPAWLAGAPRTIDQLELLQCEVPHAALMKLIDGQWALRVLHLEDDLPDDLARWLADSPAISRLDHLALGGPFTDDGLDAILKRFARFSRLKSLVLYGGVFGPTIRKWAYKQLPQLTIERRRPGVGWPGHPRHGIRLSSPPGS